VKKASILAILLIGPLAFGQVTVPNSFWGVQIHDPSSMYPVPSGPVFNVVRLWDTATGWADMVDGNPCTPPLPSYDYTVFDQWGMKYADLGSAAPAIIYTVAKTPCLLSSNPADSTCSDGGQGRCDPPKDITCTGSAAGGTGGTDDYFKNFLSGLWRHIKSRSYYATIPQWYVEIWNEPDTPGFWDNTWIAKQCQDPNAPYRFLVRMAADAKTTIQGIDSKVQFLTPPVNDPLTQVKAPNGWWYNYLLQGGYNYADVASVHGYMHQDVHHEPIEDLCCDPNNSLVGEARSTMAMFFPSGTPLFLTEGSYGGKNPHNPSDDVAFTGEYYTLALSGPGLVNNLDWYAWDITSPLWDGSSLTGSGKAVAVMQQRWGYKGARFDATGCASSSASRQTRMERASLATE